MGIVIGFGIDVVVEVVDVVFMKNDVLDVVNVILFSKKII